jgi:undecaprenyl-diphosphatase
LLLGVSREQAARFSFLMVLPPIAGATLLEVKDLMEAPAAETATDISLLTGGFIAAFISGVIACSWMVKIVKRSKLSWFALYCAVAGVIAIAAGLLS